MLTAEGYIVIALNVLMIIALYMEVMCAGLILFSATTNFGNLILKEGDNLILLTTEKFIQSGGDSKIFYLTS